jgi:hypothetical protein
MQTWSAKRTQSGRSVRWLYPNLVVHGTANPLFAAEISVNFFCMKTALYGRIVFGASAVLFGVIALMWYDSETWQALRQIWRLPFGTIIGGCLMTAQIAGGIGMQYSRTARLASVVLCVVYLCFSLACVPDIIVASNIYERYGGSFFLFLSLLCGAIALYAATETNGARALVFGRLARLGLGVCTISFMLGQALLLHETALLVPKWIPPNQMFWAILTTVAFALAAMAILTNRRAQVAIRLMTLMLAVFGVLVWVPHLIAHPRAAFQLVRVPADFPGYRGCLDGS